MNSVSSGDLDQQHRLLLKQIHQQERKRDMLGAQPKKLDNASMHNTARVDGAARDVLDLAKSWEAARSSADEAFMHRTEQMPSLRDRANALSRRARETRFDAIRETDRVQAALTPAVADDYRLFAQALVNKATEFERLAAEAQEALDESQIDEALNQSDASTRTRALQRLARQFQLRRLSPNSSPDEVLRAQVLVNRVDTLLAG